MEMYLPFWPVFVPQQSHPLQGGHGGSWVGKVSESAMPDTQSEKITATPSGQGRTQPSTCTRVHAHYPGTSPFHFTTKGSTGAEYHYKGVPHCPGPHCLCPKQSGAGYPLYACGGVSGLGSHTAQKEKRKDKKELSPGIESPLLDSIQSGHSIHGQSKIN